MTFGTRFYLGCVAGCLLAACSNQQPAPRVLDVESTDAELFGEVVARWRELGFPLTDSDCFDERARELIIPNEYFAEAMEFQDLCRSDPLFPDSECESEQCALGCATDTEDGDPLLVFADGWQDTALMRLLRAHEGLHWLADCSKLATPWANRNHAIPGVWKPMVDGAPYVLEQFERPRLESSEAEPE